LSRVVDIWGEGAWQELGLPSSPEAPSTWERCYIRFGTCDTNGRSYNERGKYLEVGNAVFRGFKTPEGRYLVVLQSSAPLAETFLRIRLNRPAFRAYGDEAAVGPAGEPLLLGVELEPLGPGRDIEATVQLPQWFQEQVYDILRRQIRAVQEAKRSPLESRLQQTRFAARSLLGRPRV